LTHGKNLGRVGSLARDKATTESGKTLWCSAGKDSKESGSARKHVSGSGSDGCPLDLGGNTLGRMKTRRATTSLQL
jgi:hypothetical protein